MFEEQYNELALAVDLIAERIQSAGVSGPRHLQGVCQRSRPSAKKRVCRALKT
jgi:DNA-binding ferritin-like protein